MPFSTPTPTPGSYLGVAAGNPPNVIQPVPGRAPTANDTAYIIGDLWINTATQISYELVGFTAGAAVWTILGGANAAIATINLNAPIAGNYTLAGTANQISKAETAGTTTFSLPAAITAPGSLTTTTTLASGTTLTAGTSASVTTSLLVGTTITATLGAITATNGNFVGSTAGTGFLFNANAASGAASGPVVLNSRAGAVTFTGVSIAAAADLTLTMTNSAVSGSGTQIVYSMKGATTGSALSIKSVTNTAGSSAVVITNGTGATTTTTDITLTFLVVN